LNHKLKMLASVVLIGTRKDSNHNFIKALKQ
jgi:hypothetical protein